MSELTKEYFDQQIAKLATSERIEDLARMVAAGFEDVQKRLDVGAQIQACEEKFQKLEEALHIKL